MPKGRIEKDAWHRRVGILCELDCHLFIFIERPYFTRTINQQEGFNYRPMTLFTGASMVKWKRPVSGQTRTRLPSTLLPYSRWWKFKCFARRYYLIRIVSKRFNVLNKGYTVHQYVTANTAANTFKRKRSVLDQTRTRLSSEIHTSYELLATLIFLSENGQYVIRRRPLIPRLFPQWQS